MCTKFEKGLGITRSKTSSCFYDRSNLGSKQGSENPKRWIININSYAEIDIPGQWDGNRNPVSYRNLKDIGIEADKLEFKALPKLTPTNSIVDQAGDEYEEEEENVVKPLTLQEAKAGLALYFGVNEENIQITIQG